MRKKSCTLKKKHKNKIEHVNHPTHYNSHPSGVECIDVVEHMNFNCGNVIKYLWRAGLKDITPSLRDIKKAQFYMNREVARLEKLGYEG